jgi:hypothetical protein
MLNSIARFMFQENPHKNLQRNLKNPQRGLSSRLQNASISYMITSVVLDISRIK